MDSGVVDLIYLDPPFNKKKQFQAPIGSEAEGASFKDWWVMDDVKFEDMELLERKHPRLTTLIRAAGSVGDQSNTPYLLYMAPRLIEMRRILKDTGSVYLHCDPTMCHSLKLLMDGVFGHQNFQNEIIWYYSGGGASKRRWARKHDVVLFYTKSNKYIFSADAVRVPYKWDKGQLRADGTARDYSKGKLADDVYEHHSLMPWAKERVGYPTQKPLALLERLIQASSNPEDLVLDPFCGCATTCVAAEKLGRQWIGIDVSPKAAELVMTRMERELGKLFPPIHRRDAPKRSEALIRSPDGALLTRLYGEQGGHCNICGVHFEKRNLTLDHIVPTSKGGPDADDNIQLLCQACNSMKGKRSQAWAMQHYEKHWRLP